MTPKEKLESIFGKIEKSEFLSAESAAKRAKNKSFLFILSGIERAVDAGYSQYDPPYMNEDIKAGLTILGYRVEEWREHFLASKKYTIKW